MSLAAPLIDLCAVRMAAKTLANTWLVSRGSPSSNVPAL